LIYYCSSTMSCHNFKNNKYELLYSIMKEGM